MSGIAARREKLGLLVSLNGSQGVVWLPLTKDGSEDITIGKLIMVETSNSQVIGMITQMSIPLPEAEEAAYRPTLAEVDLVGEITERDGLRRFRRGVTTYPAIKSNVVAIGANELALIHQVESGHTIAVGTLQQDSSVKAYVDSDDLLSKHFAILGTTGVGKSSGVALILSELIDKRDDLRVCLIDPHNEYGSCFGDRAKVISPSNLKLPFWLFVFEELIDVFFRGRPGVEEEVEILSEAIPLAKARFALNKARTDRILVRKNQPQPDTQSFSGAGIDTPVPYRISDLLAIIDERMGKLENRSSWTKYSRLMTRIETLAHDPRYAFMFDNINIEDTMMEVLSEIFRLPAKGKPMTIIQLAGFPSEVVDSVVSVLCRMAFDFGLWSDGALPLLLVCEEAHRYAPADRTIGFGPTRRSISRIAKEGRKYGVYLGVVTQRPADLDSNILSQCSTIFALRMANERDQAIVKAAVSDAASSLLGFLPALGTQEVIAFGEAVAIPVRLRFRTIDKANLPQSQLARARLDSEVVNTTTVDAAFIEAVIDRWRGATSINRTRPPDRSDVAASILRSAGVNPERGYGAIDR